MNQTPPELLAPYKAALVAAGRDAIRAIRETGAAGARYEIPGTVPLALVVVGDEAEVARLLRAPAREPMLGGRRAGDPPAPELTFDEPPVGEPRRWTILLTSEGHGLVGAQGNTFEAAHERHERLDVVEASAHDQLRRAVRDIAGMLAANEWAESLATDPDLAALEQQVSRLVCGVAPAAPRRAVPAGWTLVATERSYDQRAKSIIAFNTCTGDLDDKLQAAHEAMLRDAYGPRTSERQEGD